jgi:hypothetical protein
LGEDRERGSGQAIDGGRQCVRFLGRAGAIAHGDAGVKGHIGFGQGVPGGRLQDPVGLDQRLKSGLQANAAG